MTNEQKAEIATKQRFESPEGPIVFAAMNGFEQGYLQCLNDNPVLGNLLQITWLSSNHLSLDHYRYLEAVAKEEEVGSNKWTRHLEKHGFTFNNEVTEKGKEILQIVPHLKGNAPLTKEKKVRLENPEFELWWKSFPSSDNFKFENRSFTGVRSLKTKKDQCEAEYKKILSEGKYTSEDLLRFLETEKTLRMKGSLQENKNIMSFFTNSHTYLTSRKFEIYITPANSPSQAKTKSSFNITI